MKRWMVAGLIATATFASADAQAVKPTVSGRLVSLNGASGIAEIRTETGKIWKIRLLPNAKYELMGRNTTRAAFQQGQQVAFRIVGSLAESPLQSDLMCDWGSSGKYVATAAPAPYYTNKGEYATTGGVGGAPEGAPAGQRPDKTIGILGNGGKDPSLNVPGGTQSMNQGSRMALASNLNAGADPAGMPGTSLMGLDENGNGQQGGPSGMAGGTQVQFSGTILESTPGGRSMRVRMGDGSIQNILLPANINPAALRPGQMVQITGSANNGIVEAQQVIPVASMQQ